MRGGSVASMLCANVCRGPLECWADGPVGGLKGRDCVGVDDEGALEGVARGPVGIVEGPFGVDGDGKGPGMCLVGGCVHPPRPPPRGANPPRAGGTYPRGPAGGLVGLVVSDRRGGAVGVCVRTGGGGAGVATGVVKFLFAEGPVGGARRAAGPRGGEREAGVVGSYGVGRAISLRGTAPGIGTWRGDSSRGWRGGERALIELGRGDDLPEAD